MKGIFVLHQIIRRFSDHLDKVRLEMGWRYDADQGLWIRHDWLIEETPFDYRLISPIYPDRHCSNLHDAMRIVADLEKASV